MKNLEVINAGNPNYDRLHFYWFLVDWCNYKCSYCCTSDEMREVFSKEESSSKYKLALQRLKKVEVPYNVDLYGGEPTLHKDIHLILNELSSFENCKQIEIRTNLSRSLEFIQDLFVHDKVIVEASYHPEYDSQTFVDKCIALKDNNFYCLISLSDNQLHWKSTLDLIQIFKETNVKYQFNFLYSTTGKTIEYSNEFYNTFVPLLPESPRYNFNFKDGSSKKLTAFDIRNLQLGNFKGSRCNALMYNIDINGEIKNSCNGQPLPLIIRKEILDKYITCPINFCRCDDMLNFYKTVPTAKNNQGNDKK